MSSVQPIDEIDELRELADEKRLAILQRLMAAPATLSQLGQALGRHPAWVRHHLKRLEDAGLVELTGTRRIPGFVEKYYGATAQAYTVTRLITPRLAESGALVVAGSNDLALDVLARAYGRAHPDQDMWLVPLGSLDGLIALRQGLCRCAGSHLLDGDSGEYNLPSVRSLFPGERMALTLLARRRQGLIVAKGNPLGLTAVADLARPGVRIAARQKGSGTRVRLDLELRRVGLDGAIIAGYDTALSTHAAVAQAVASGGADVALGLEAAGAVNELDFVPLFWEEFELVYRATDREAADIARLLGVMESDVFRREVEALPGYDLEESGRTRYSE